MKLGKKPLVMETVSLEASMAALIVIGRAKATIRAMSGVRPR